MMIPRPLWVSLQPNLLANVMPETTFFLYFFFLKVKASLQRPSYNRSVFVEGESTQKQDLELEHDLGAARGGHQKARLLARRRAPKNTVFCTRESTKHHHFSHEGKH